METCTEKHSKCMSWGVVGPAWPVVGLAIHLITRCLARTG